MGFFSLGIVKLTGQPIHVLSLNLGNLDSETLGNFHVADLPKCANFPRQVEHSSLKSVGYLTDTRQIGRMALVNEMGKILAVVVFAFQREVKPLPVMSSSLLRAAFDPGCCWCMGSQQKLA